MSLVTSRGVLKPIMDLAGSMCSATPLRYFPPRPDNSSEPACSSPAYGQPKAVHRITQRPLEKVPGPDAVYFGRVLQAILALSGYPRLGTGVTEGLLQLLEGIDAIEKMVLGNLVSKDATSLAHRPAGTYGRPRCDVFQFGHNLNEAVKQSIGEPLNNNDVCRLTNGNGRLHDPYHPSALQHRRRQLPLFLDQQFRQRHTKDFLPGVNRAEMHIGAFVFLFQELSNFGTHLTGRGLQRHTLSLAYSRNTV